VKAKVKRMTLSLGLGGGGGTYIRFSPSINSWQLGKDEFDLKKIVFDLDTIKTGWGLVTEGQAPQWIWDERIGQMGIKPEGDFKRGFSVRVWLGPDRGWAEWSSTGTGPKEGFSQLWSVAGKQKTENDGKVVMCAYTGSTPLKVGKGNTRVPNFEIIGWIDRPSHDDIEDEAPTSATSRTAPPATGSKVVPPPAAKKQADLANMDFG
jgi:hypothetical protein